VRRLGVVGTLVWDRIFHPGVVEPFAGWGGIAYSLHALAAALPKGWEAVPLVPIGEDMRSEAEALLAGIPRVAADPPPPVVPRPNNRVELRYHDPHHRCERLSGGVGGWSAAELIPRLADVDALYVNLISGQELALSEARAVRRAFPGPIYADLHSLLLATDPGGRRFPRPLPAWREWAECWDAIQTNDEELRVLAGDVAPEAFAEELLAAGAAWVFTTRGPDGADALRRADASADPLRWPAERGPARGSRHGGAVRIHEPAAAVAGDPTGCGDVWGATLFARLLGGEDAPSAMAHANAAAAANAAARGVEGLHRRLRVAR
jgi:hypothetical protein